MIIKVLKLPEDLGLLIDGATEIVKHEIKKKTRMWIFWWFLGWMAPMTASLIALMTSSLINVISAKTAVGAGKGRVDRFLPLLSLSLMMNVMGKWVTRAGREYDNMDHIDISLKLDF